MDGARHPRAAFSRTRFHATARAGNQVVFARYGVGIFVAYRATAGRLAAGPARVHGCRGVRRIHYAPDRSSQDRAFFFAFSPRSSVLFGYVWNRADFPWLGIWEENHSRKQPPWNGETLTRGLEFGASPIPESRRKMIGRNNLFGVPAYRWARPERLCTCAITPLSPRRKRYRRISTISTLRSPGYKVTARAFRRF